MFYYVVDTETSGLKSDWHEIFQISIIRCSDRHQFSKYIKVEHPERASHEALAITGSTKADLVMGSDKKKVVEQIDDWLEEDGLTAEDRCFVGHNIAFDRRFCQALWSSLGKKLQVNCWLDSENIAKGWAAKNGVERPKRLSLQAALDLTKIAGFSGAHNAIVDARNCYLIWRVGTEEDVDYLPHIKRQPHE